jgi:hypothetical protein
VVPAATSKGSVDHKRHPGVADRPFPSMILTALSFKWPNTTETDTTVAIMA